MRTLRALAGVGAGVALQVIGAQAGRLLDEHGAAADQVAQAVVARDRLFGAHPLGVGDELAPLLVERLEHLAQTADGGAERLHVLQEEVVLGGGQQARDAARCLARLRRVEHAHAGVERGLHDHGVRCGVVGAHGVLQTTAERLHGERVRLLDEDALRVDAGS